MAAPGPQPAPLAPLSVVRHPRPGYNVRMGILITWLLYSAGLAVAAALLSGFEIKGGLKGTLLVAALFGVLNWLLEWLLTFLFKLLLLPFTLVFAELVSLLVHTLVTAIVLALTDGLSDRLKIRNFWTALAAALLMSSTVFLIRKVLG